MFFTSQLKAYIYNLPVDMRKSYNGLEAIVRNEVKKDPINGQLYVFFNQIRDKVKIFYWDTGGFCIWSKRLEKGTFRKIFESMEFERKDLMMLLEGIDPKQIKMRKRYKI